MILLWTAVAHAATWTVDVAGGADFETISEAMLASSDGDTIEVADGVYEEAVVFPSHDLRVISVDGGAVIDSSSLSVPTVWMRLNTRETHFVGFQLVPESSQRAMDLELSSPQVDGLRIINPTPGNRVLVYVESGEPIFTDCLFQDIGDRSSIIVTTDNSSLEIRSCSFINNTGMQVNASGHLILEECWFQDVTDSTVVLQHLRDDEATQTVLNQNTWLGVTRSPVVLYTDALSMTDNTFQADPEHPFTANVSGAVRMDGVTASGMSLLVVAWDLSMTDLDLEGPSDGGPSPQYLYADIRGSLELRDSHIHDLSTSSTHRMQLRGATVTLEDLQLSHIESPSNVLVVQAEEITAQDISLVDSEGPVPLLLLSGNMVQVDHMTVTDNTSSSTSSNTRNNSSIVDILGQDLVLLSHLNFERNDAGTGSGALAIGGSQGHLGNSSFCDNHGQAGGAVKTHLSDRTFLYNNVFWDNTASEEGGAVLIEGGLYQHPKSLTNNTFVANQAPSGSAVSLDGDYSFINNVLAHHTETASLASSASYSGVWDNERDFLVEGYDQETLNANPGFANYTADGRCNDALWLAEDSPYRDAGDPDLADLDGSRSDIGFSGGRRADPSLFDGDGDGIPHDQDCDDSDTQKGGEAEVPYDGVDNDCDENTPDDDLDGDGFGIDEDCDDTDPAAYPGAPELDCSTVEETPLTPKSRCSCQSTSPASSWMLFALLLPLLRRRPTP